MLAIQALIDIHRGDKDVSREAIRYYGVQDEDLKLVREIAVTCRRRYGIISLNSRRGRRILMEIGKFPSRPKGMSVDGPYVPLRVRHV